MFISLEGSEEMLLRGGESRGVYKGIKIKGISVRELHVGRDRTRKSTMCLRKDKLFKVLSPKKWN